MNLKSKLAVAALFASSISMAQATMYNVTGITFEGATGGTNNEFHGMFDWDASTGTMNSFSGTMNEAMQGAWTDVPGHDYVDGYDPGFGTWEKWMVTLDQDGDNNNYEVMNTNGIVTATVFRNDTNNVFKGGGYDGANGYQEFGQGDANVASGENAFFTVAFRVDGSNNITSLGMNIVAANVPLVGTVDTDLVNAMAYGDCTGGSMMMMGNCMAGELTGSSMMEGIPMAINIEAVSAVPVPAAAWLFGGALMSLIGANRRKNVLPA